MARISGLGCFFLVALRLVIGWHFAVEGVWKIRTHQIGRTSTNTPWTSEGFFREAYGPIGDWYRQQLMISDEPTLSRFRANGEEGSEAQVDWILYWENLELQYSLDKDQRALATKAFSDHYSRLRDWILSRSAPIIKKQVIWGTADVPVTLKAQFAEYEAKQREIAKIQGSEQTNFNKDVDRTRLRSLKTDAATILNDIVSEYDIRTKAMKKDVEDSAKLTPDQLKLGPVHGRPAPPRLIDKLDTLTMWMQAVLGAFLLIGLCTRLSSLVLAGFLLQVVLERRLFRGCRRRRGLSGTTCMSICT